MDNRLFKIYNQKDFDSITKGIKVAKCMRLKSSIVPDAETIFSQLEDLTVSDSLSCSFCNKIFEDQAQQRSHYKLDWHRYNLKQRLRGFASITEDEFDILADEDDVSSLSGSESSTTNPENASETNSTDNTTKNPSQDSKSSPTTTTTRTKKFDRKLRLINSISSDSEGDETSEAAEKRKHEALTATASRHSKVFFENDQGNIFSIYRCLLHSKKDIPEVNDEMIAQAINSGKRTTWTVIMLGGGHFAAGIFQDGDVLVHKTFHKYTVRAKQGSSQSQRDNRGTGYAKSAGASLRRYNEALLIQNVQEILELWVPHIINSSLILYRAVGPQNRTILFGGKNPTLDKNDSRLRPIPFPTRRATFSEVQRVYDILSTVEIYGSACNFTDSFPISPRQPIRKKINRIDLLDEIPEKNTVNLGDVNSSPDISKGKSSLVLADRHRSPKINIDRAKPRKSPSRPLPDIITRLAMSSSESEHDSPVPLQYFNQICEINFKDNLLAFEDTLPRYMRQKKSRRQRKKVKKDKQEEPVNQILQESKLKFWTACKIGDIGLLNDTWGILLEEIKRWESLERKEYEEGIEEKAVENCQEYENIKQVELKMENVLCAINEANDDGNTLLHLAAIEGHLDIIWSLMEMGTDPCRKNKKNETPYAATNDKDTRNTFRRFMAINPDKFDYQKSQIPAPLTQEIEQEEMKRKRQLRKAKREKEKVKKREFEIKKQEEDSKQRFLNLSDREKRALAAEQRILKQNGVVMARCFQCAADMSGKVPFEYNSNRFCSMPCLKEHRLHNKFIV